jgi:hypothetical protein
MPIALNDFLIDVNLPPDAVFEAQTSARGGLMNVRVPIELATLGMQGYKQAYFDTAFLGPFQ